MHAVRKRILNILKEEGGATVAELAKVIEMAPVSVRHHLDILQGDNLIRVDHLKRKGNVGRPQQVYALTSEANALFPNDFASLTANLVRQLKQVLPPAEVEQAFAAIAHQMAQEAPLPDLEQADFETRLDRVTDYLNEHGYLARWERVEGDAVNGNAPAYLLHKHNCPYAGVSDEHPELCTMDQKLVDELVGGECERIQSMTGEERCCTYRVPAVQSGAIESITLVL